MVIKLGVFPPGESINLSHCTDNAFTNPVILSLIEMPHSKRKAIPVVVSFASNGGDLQWNHGILDHDKLLAGTDNC